jgi:hypothetical protein
MIHPSNLHSHQTETPSLSTDQFKSNIETALSDDLLQLIFTFLPVYGRASSVLALVSKKWRRLFDGQHLLKRLKNGQFPFSANYLISISSLAKNKATFAKIQTALGLWLDTLIPNCTQKSPHASFILDNIWLNPVHSDLSCSHSEIAEVLKKIKNMQMTCYMPWLHLPTVAKRENLPEKILKEALRLRYLQLLDIPNNQRTFKICHFAVLHCGESLEFVPENLRTVEICRAAVQRNGYDIQFVPDNQKTPELYLLAVQSNGHALQYVPSNLRSAKICLSAVQRIGIFFEMIPENLKTAEICRAAVQKKGQALKFVPKNLKTAEICLVAVQQAGLALEFVPENLKTA